MKEKNWMRILILSSLAACMLLGYRVFYTEKITFLFLAWNLFLAWIPFVISSGLKQSDSMPVSAKIFLLGVWLLFLPNAPYILTDLFHLYKTRGVPMWFDLCLILTFAWTGLLLGFVSIRQVLDELKTFMHPVMVHLSTVFIFFITAFGVYLGRFGRWNSWDIITQPVSLLEDISQYVIHPFTYDKAWMFSLCFGLFLGVAYLAFGGGEIRERVAVLPKANHE